MGGLTPWAELPVGGTVDPASAPRARTGGWRTEGRPEADLARCVNCLLCWVYCPDSAVELDGTRFAGFDYEVCKGCAVCLEVCPTGALELVEEGS